MEKPEQQFTLKWKAIAAVMVMVCASLLTGVAIGSGDGGRSIPVVIESGSGVETASYIIYKDGDYTCAKNGTTGRIEERSMNATLVIQDVIDSMDGVGGTLFISSGVYEVYELHINHSISIKGSGNGKTVGEYDGVSYTTILESFSRGTVLVGLDDQILNVTQMLADDGIGTLTGISICDLTLYGNHVANTGLMVTYGVGTVISNVLVAYCNEFGMELPMGHSVTIRDCTIWNCGKDAYDHGAIKLGEKGYGMIGARIQNCRLEWCGTGIFMTQAVSTTIDSNVIEGMEYYGIYANSTSVNGYAQFNTISNCYFEDNNNATVAVVDDVHISGASTNTHIADCYFTGVHVRYAIYAQGEYFHISNIGSNTKKIFLVKNMYATVENSIELIDPSLFPFGTSHALGADIVFTGTRATYSGSSGIIAGSDNKVLTWPVNLVGIPRCVIVTSMDARDYYLYVTNVTISGCVVHVNDTVSPGANLGFYYFVQM